MVSSSEVAVRDTLIDQLAYARGCPRDDIVRLIEADGGDLEIDSKEGQVVAILAEGALGLPGLIRPEDQHRRHLTSISSLTNLIERRRAESRTAQEGSV
jgi:hypothetical protein